MSPSAWPVCRYAPCPGWFRPRRRWRVWRQPRGRPWRGTAEAAGHNLLGLRCRMRRSCSWLNWDSSVLLSRHCHTLLINLPLSQRTSHRCSEKTFFMFQTFVSVCTMRGECLLWWKVASVRSPAQTWRHWAGKCSNSRAYSGLPSVFGPRKVTEMVTWPIICTFSISGKHNISKLDIIYQSNL